MKVVFVIAQWNSEEASSPFEDAYVASRAARVVIDAGAAPVVPQLTLATTWLPKDGQFWLDACITLLGRCDAAVLAPNWRSAKWCATMVEGARMLGRPVFDLSHHSGARDLRLWCTAAPRIATTAAPQGAAGSPVCVVCNDTHQVVVEDRGRTFMCGYCPAPCPDCRSQGVGAYCATTPCACTCHRKEPRTSGMVSGTLHPSAPKATVPAVLTPSEGDPSL